MPTTISVTAQSCPRSTRPIKHFYNSPDGTPLSSPRMQSLDALEMHISRKPSTVRVSLDEIEIQVMGRSRDLEKGHYDHDLSAAPSSPSISTDHGLEHRNDVEILPEEPISRPPALHVVERTGGQGHSE
jgi:hypothetical protein